jgi:hypothetical protein
MPFQWRLQEVRQHLRHTERFLELLCLAVHIAGGQPARGPELLSIRWRDGVLQDRNLYVIVGQVALVTRYHKTQSQWDKPKVIVRFLPEAIGKLAIAYLLYVRPLRALLQSALGLTTMTRRIMHDPRQNRYSVRVSSAQTGKSQA